MSSQTRVDVECIAMWPHEKRLRHLLKLECGLFENLMDNATSNATVPKGLKELIEGTCKKMKIPGGCIPKVGGAQDKGVALSYCSDIDIRVETPNHTVTKAQRNIFNNLLEEGFPSLGLHKTHVGRKALHVATEDNDIDIDISFPNATWWKDVDPDPVPMNKHEMAAVKALKIVFRQKGSCWPNFLFEELIKKLKGRPSGQLGCELFRRAVDHLRNYSEVVQAVVEEERERRKQGHPNPPKEKDKLEDHARWMASIAGEVL